MKEKYMNNKPIMVRNIILAISFFIFLPLTQGNCQKQNLNVISNWLMSSDAPNCLYHELANQAYKQLARRDSIISQIKTLSDWKQRQQKKKKDLLDIVGPFPEKTPLNAKITKKVKKNDYTIENIIFESQPGFYVTSSLFIPNGLKKKAPAIIVCLGH